VAGQSFNHTRNALNSRATVHLPALCVAFPRPHMPAPAYINLSREKVMRLTNQVSTNQITTAAMSGLSLQCGDCGVLLQSVEEAQAHIEATSYSNLAVSTELVLPAGACGKLCRSQTVISS
jgi:hypothetical protein